MHFGGDFFDCGPKVVEMDIGVVGEQGHGDGAVGDFFGDHPGGEPHAERIVVHSGLPYTDFIAFPRFEGSNGSGDGWYVRDVTTTTGSGILQDGNGVQRSNSGGQFAVFFRTWWIIRIGAGASWWIVKGPVFGISLTALHGQTMKLIEGFCVFCQVPGGEVDIFFWHLQIFIDSVEAKAEIRLGEGERMVHPDGLSIFDPFVHTPEMGIFQIDL